MGVVLKVRSERLEGSEGEVGELNGTGSGQNKRELDLRLGRDFVLFFVRLTVIRCD